MRHTQYLPIGAALLSIISLQTGAALAKTAFSTIGPEGMSALRVGIAAIILCCFTKPWRIRCNSSELVNILFFGVTLGLMNLFIYMAFKYMPVGIAISMEVIGPLAVTLLSSRQPKDLISILFAVTGLTLLPIGGNNTSIELLGVVYVGHLHFSGGCTLVQVVRSLPLEVKASHLVLLLRLCLSFHLASIVEL
ncbi:EamA family transporter [Aeromonas hydrophila]|uniref:EamA family transporter n=1 Tax=Aeromonas hydrophila TaxID=644 RepID=UPI0019678F47|nr:EamA family transporter [Aeromonas hydrophila]